MIYKKIFFLIFLCTSDIFVLQVPCSISEQQHRIICSPSGLMTTEHLFSFSVERHPRLVLVES